MTCPNPVFRKRDRRQAFCFVTLASTTLQLHSSAAFRARIMALWVFVYLGTTPIGSVLTGWIISAGAWPTMRQRESIDCR